MEQYIPKSDLVAEIERLKSIQLSIFSRGETEESCYESLTCISVYNEILSFIDTLEVKKVDIDKMLYFRRNIGFAYPEGASEYQKHLACYRQGIEDVLKAQKGEET